MEQSDAELRSELADVTRELQSTRAEHRTALDQAGRLQDSLRELAASLDDVRERQGASVEALESARGDQSRLELELDSARAQTRLVEEELANSERKRAEAEAEAVRAQERCDSLEQSVVTLNCRLSDNEVSGIGGFLTDRSDFTWEPQLPC